MYMCTCIYTLGRGNSEPFARDFDLFSTPLSCSLSEFLISFEAWAKLAQQWLVCAPLGIHLEPIN